MKIEKEQIVRIRFLLSLVLLTGLIPSVGIAAENNSSPIRSLIDRPDDLIGYQVRLIYVVPADVKDRNLDTNGTIRKWIDEVRKISRAQTGLTPRFDTYQNKFDIGFLNSKYTIAQLIGTSGTRNADDLLRKELPISEQDSLKGIGFIIDGRVSFSDYCGYASRPGKYFTAWLGESCWEDSDWYNNRPYITWMALSILHEWLHNLGVKHTCVKDDLMWGDGCEAIEQGDNNSIDANRLNYLRASKSGIDISLLPVWEETFKSGVIDLEFQSKAKSSNPWRNPAGDDEFWGSFELSKDWASASSIIRTCEVKTSTGLTLSSTMTGSNCYSKLPHNVKIGTRIYMTVTINGLWQRSSGVLIFDALGEKGEERYCESTTCILGETLKIDIDYCFKVEGFGKLQIKKNDNWTDLKTHKTVLGLPGCGKDFPYSVVTTLKELPVGTHTLRWARATDRAFTQSFATYKEFQIIIKPEVIK
jgi:hypothetical protein